MAAGSARARTSRTHSLRPGPAVWDTGHWVNVATLASDARMKTQTSATTANRDAAPIVQPSFTPGAEWVLHEPLGARPLQAREK